MARKNSRKHSSRKSNRTTKRDRKPQRLILLTYDELEQLGLPTDYSSVLEMYRRDEKIPWDVDGLISDLESEVYGINDDGRPLSAHIGEGDITIRMVLRVNGSDYDILSSEANRSLMPFLLKCSVVPMLMRLMRDEGLTLDDLAADGISNETYKALVAHQLGGPELYDEKCRLIEQIERDQLSDPHTSKVLKVMASTE